MIGCTALDNLLGGGLEPGIITLLYGEPGTGKTTICLQASRNCASQGQRVVFVTSDCISQKRLMQICGKGYGRALENMLFFSPLSLREQGETLDKSAKIACGLLIIDAANKYYRLEICDDEDAATRIFTRQLVALQLEAKKKMIPVLITGQVYAYKERIKPFANKIMMPLAKTIIHLERRMYSTDSYTGEREALLIKHREQKKGMRGTFMITEGGVE